MPILVMNATPLNSAYTDENILPEVDDICITGPMPLNIIDAL